MKTLVNKLFKTMAELKRLEQEPDNQVRKLSLTREYEGLQRRYYKLNGFNWNPLMYEEKRYLR